MTDKAVSPIREAVLRGAKLVVFPGVFILAFPLWAGLWAPIHNHNLVTCDETKRMSGNALAHIKYYLYHWRDYPHAARKTPGEAGRLPVDLKAEPAAFYKISRRE